jgi:carbamoyl-phosphate synthase large subunit
MKLNILITGIGSSNSISFVKGLCKQDEIGFTVIGTDIYDREFSTGAHFVDKFYKVPCAVDSGFVSSLLDICKKNKVQVVVPIIDEEFMPVSLARKSFEQMGIKVLLPGHEQILLCQDKFKTYEFFKKNGFPTPETWLGVPASPRYPILMKPRIGRGSKGIRIIQNELEFEAYKGSDGYIYQEVITGKEFTVDTLSDADGKVLAAVPRVRMEIKNGVSYKGRTVKNKIVEETSIKICEAVKLTGPACIQCILTAEGTPYFFEINPRIGSAVILTIQAGVNIPLLAVKSILGMNVPNMVDNFRDNIIMLRYWDEVFNSAER